MVEGTSRGPDSVRVAIEPLFISSPHTPPIHTHASQVHPERLQEVDLGSILRKYKGKEVSEKPLPASMLSVASLAGLYWSLIIHTDGNPHSTPTTTKPTTGPAGAQPRDALRPQVQVPLSLGACIGRTAGMRARQLAASAVSAWEGHEGRGVLVCLRVAGRSLTGSGWQSRGLGGLFDDSIMSGLSMSVCS